MKKHFVLINKERARREVERMIWQKHTLPGKTAYEVCNLP